MRSMVPSPTDRPRRDNLTGRTYTPGTQAKTPPDDLITARLNEIYNEVDSSLEPCYMSAQAEVLESDAW